jgi:hypothetical protein
LVQGGAKILDRGHQGHGFGRAGIETECEVESSSLLGDSVDHDPSYPDGVGRLRDAPRGISKYGAAETVSLVGAVHRKAGEEDDWDGIRHVSPKPAWYGGLRYGARGQGVIARYALVFANHEGAGGTAGLVRTCAAPEPVIEGGFPRSETVEFMMFG